MDKDILLEKLKSNDNNEVREAIEELQKFEDNNVIKEIVKTALTKKSKIVLEAAVNTLMIFNNKKTVAQYVVDMLFSDSPKIRHGGIEVLASCGDYAVEIIEEKIISHPDFNIRKYGLDILKEVKSYKALKVLENLLNDENPNVKYSAFEFLMNFGKFREQVIDIIIDFVKNEPFDNLYGTTTIASTIIYGNYTDKKMIPVLKEKLKNINNDLIEHWIYKTLIYCGDKEIIPEAVENAKKVDMLNVIENDIQIAKDKGIC